MFKQGPIPAFVHGVLEYLIAALLIAAPFLADFEDDTAVAVSIVAGVLRAGRDRLDGPADRADQVDPGAGARDRSTTCSPLVLIASPFLFAFTDDGTATAFFIVLGVLHLLITIGTRFVSEERPRRRRQAS